MQCPAADAECVDDFIISHGLKLKFILKILAHYFLGLYPNTHSTLSIFTFDYVSSNQQIDLSHQSARKTQASMVVLDKSTDENCFNRNFDPAHLDAQSRQKNSPNFSNCCFLSEYEKGECQVEFRIARFMTEVCEVLKLTVDLHMGQLACLP